MGILRIVLAISVLLVHSKPFFGMRLVGGVHAVHAFYIISGFYMSLILNEKYTKQIKNSYQIYIKNRLLRLYPIYWLVLVLTLLLFLYQTYEEQKFNSLNQFIIYSKNINLYNQVFLILTNILIFGQDIVMFIGLDFRSGNFYFTSDFHFTNPKLYSFLLLPQAWTLSLELMFYLIAPFLVRRSIITIISIIALTFTARALAISYNLDHDPWNYRFFPFELGFFLLGTISYHIYRKIKNLQFVDKYSYIAIIILLPLIIFFYWIPLKTLILYSAITLLIPFIFHATKKSKLDRLVGELSYPMYISHLLILNLLTYVNQNDSVMLIISTVLFSILLNELVSNNVEKIRNKLAKKAQI